MGKPHAEMWVTIKQTPQIHSTSMLEFVMYLLEQHGWGRPHAVLQPVDLKLRPQNILEVFFCIVEKC